MREVFKWDKDYRTGETKTVKALKPSDVIGKVKIELRNKDGELVREVHSENLIPTTFYLPSVYRVAYRDVVSGGDSNENIQLKYYSKAFQQIVLKEDDREESIDNRFCKGGTIGYCPKTDQNAGSSSFRGVYNPIESFTENKGSFYHAHMVYDFNTAQGNGTFNSIWWTRAINNSSSTAPLCAFDTYLPPSLNSEAVSSIYRNHKGEYFKYKDSKWYKILNDIREVVNTGYIELDINTVEKIGAYSSHAFDDGKKYITQTYLDTDKVKNFNRILTINVHNTSDDEIVQSYELNYRELFPDIVECADKYTNHGAKWFNGGVTAIDNEGNCLISVFCKVSSVWDSTTAQTNYYVFPMLDGKFYAYVSLRGVFNLNTGTWVIYPRLGDEKSEQLHMVTKDHVVQSLLAYTVVKYGNDIFMTTNQSSYDKKGIFVFEGGLTGNIYATTPNASVQNYGSSPDYISCYVPECDVFLPGAQKSNNCVYKLSYPYSAHTKLPKPVTKTSADTMKVIYDYYIQIPWAFEANGNHVPDLSIPQD